MSDGFILSSVKWFNRDKGYGFLKGTGDGLDVFVHANQLRKSGIETALVEGEQVKFKIESGSKGKYAVNISKVDANGNPWSNGNSNDDSPKQEPKDAINLEQTTQGNVGNSTRVEAEGQGG